MRVGDRVSDVISGLRQAIGENSMLAYVVMMSIRLIELHRVLKPTGSLYLHCDPTASHYLKVVLDAIFQPENFKNEIAWKRSTAHNDATRYGSIHDTILFYVKSYKNYTWNKTYTPYSEEYLEKFYRYEDERGRYQADNLSAKGLQGGGYQFEYKGVNMLWRFPKRRIEELDNNSMIHWPKKTGSIPRIKRYLKDAKGIPLQDIFLDINPLSSNRSKNSERLGYPTQKPIALLERIIKASSNENDVVLDPFCGCGTAVHAAEKLKREWVGIDITHLAIGLIEYRLKEAFDIEPDVIGVPTTLESAKELAKRNKFQFEAWAVTRIDGICPNEKQVGDRGIDGRGYIYLGNVVKEKPNYTKVIVSVKGGENLNPSMVRDLKGTVVREKAGFGIFICIATPTKKMQDEAVTGGFVETPLGAKYPKIQIYTIQDYFNGKKPQLPSRADYLEVIKEPHHTNTGKDSTLPF